MKRPRWVSALALTFAFVGVLLAGGALHFFHHVDKSGSGWYPGMVPWLLHEVAKLFLELAIWLIATSIGLWRAPVRAMRISGSTAIGISLLPFMLRLVPESVISLFLGGFALLTLGPLAFIARLFLFGLGLALIFYSRDAEMEATDAAIDG